MPNADTGIEPLLELFPLPKAGPPLLVFVLVDGFNVVLVPKTFGTGVYCFLGSAYIIALGFVDEDIGIVPFGL